MRRWKVVVGQEGIGNPMGDSGSSRFQLPIELTDEGLVSMLRTFLFLPY
jgi:hypothetical protein